MSLSFTFCCLVRSHIRDKCVPGRFTDVQGASDCTACETGYHAANYSAVACDKCPVGRYQSAGGQADCPGCAKGRYNPSDAQSNCLSCAGDTVYVLYSCHLENLQIQNHKTLGGKIQANVSGIACEGIDIFLSHKSLCSLFFLSVIETIK